MKLIHIDWAGAHVYRGSPDTLRAIISPRVRHILMDYDMEIEDLVERGRIDTLTGEALFVLEEVD